MLHRKGIYIDGGHEREDVVKYRSIYLKAMEEYRSNGHCVVTSNPHLQLHQPHHHLNGLTKN